MRRRAGVGKNVKGVRTSLDEDAPSRRCLVIRADERQHGVLGADHRTIDWTQSTLS